MLRRILLAIDNSTSSQNAQRLALELAVSHAASIRGLAITDSARYTVLAPSFARGGLPDNVGIQAELAAARRGTDEAIEEFGELASASAVDYSVSKRDGSPDEIMEEEAAFHDLIVIGRDAYQHFYDSYSPSSTANVLVHDSPRPILVASDVTTSLSRIIVAFDGSIPASRSLHLLCLLRLHVGRKLQVLAVCKTREAAQRIASPASALLAAHGATDIENLLVESEMHPADILMNQAQAWSAGGIVMGAYGHRRLRDQFLGSTTQRLIWNSPVALFLHS